MGQAISAVLPFAIGVAISPIPLVAVIVVLFSDRAKANGLAFLLGWMTGLAVLLTAVYVVARAVGVATDDTASDSSSTIRMVLGVALVVAGLRRWRRRPRGGGEAAMPKWMAGVEHCTPLKAAAFGVLLGAVNPKNLLLTLGAAAGLADLDLADGDAVVGLVAFVLIASSVVAVIVAARWFGGERSEAGLDDLKAWLSLHNDAVMAVLFLVFGAVLLSQGLGRIS